MTTSTNLRGVVPSGVVVVVDRDVRDFVVVVVVDWTVEIP
eukprot:CAMPEP_0170791996 /NCGR_PEP_ID=MMETSP0733-20121128/21544_1 /TAXON_ID=186038 /ORGANISM="Fragilariopsis kerguelensis, Strain L26-C5" /LENGTH=39 /DNA_ID= /DNA_START= /DNA_END= /DNA_ORIENTATION=